jgi:hypothetical protein
MRKLTLLGAASVGMVIGAVAFHTTPAYADLPVIDPASIAEEIKQLAQESGILSVLQAVQTINQGISSAIGSTTFGSTNTLLQEGFTQNANYSKAQIGAQEQIADASNEAMGQYMLQLRDAQIRDQQTVSPTQCAALDGGVSTQSAAHQAFQVAYTIAKIQDERDQGWPTIPTTDRHKGRQQQTPSISTAIATRTIKRQVFPAQLTQAPPTRTRVSRPCSLGAPMRPSKP